MADAPYGAAKPTVRVVRRGCFPKRADVEDVRWRPVPLELVADPGGRMRRARRADQPRDAEAAALQGELNSFSYGYDLTCVVNGHNPGITGGHYESLEPV